MDPRRSQVEALLAYLRNHPEGIDRDDAKAELGIGSLSRRVCDLKDRGHKNAKKRKKVPPRYSGPTAVVVYSLEKKKKEALDLFRQIKAGKPVESARTKRLTRDGRVLDVWLTVTKLEDKHGRVNAVATTERNLTDLPEA